MRLDDVLNNKDTIMNPIADTIGRKFLGLDLITFAHHANLNLRKFPSNSHNCEWSWKCPQHSAHKRVLMYLRVYTMSGFIHQVHWLCHFIPKILQITFHIQRHLRGVTHQLPTADVVYTELMMTIRELNTGCLHSAAIVGTSNTTYSSGRWIGSAVVIDPVSYCELPFQVWEFMKLMMQSYKSSQRRIAFSSNNHFNLPSTLLIMLTTEPRMVSILQAHGWILS